MKLTFKQEKFCAEYIATGGNATEAYSVILQSEIMAS